MQNFLFIFLCLFFPFFSHVNNVIEKSVTTRVCDENNSVNAKKKAIKDAYLKIADSLLNEKGLTINDVKTIENANDFSEEKLLEVFSNFVESFSINEEKISFNEYQARFNFKIFEEKFNAWAFYLVNQMMKNKRGDSGRQSFSNDIYSKEVPNENELQVVIHNDQEKFATNKTEKSSDDNQMFCNDKIIVECRFNSCFSEWMYFFKDKIESILKEHDIIQISDEKVIISIEKYPDDINSLNALFNQEGLRFFADNNGKLVIEQNN